MTHFSPTPPLLLPTPSDLISTAFTIIYGNLFLISGGPALNLEFRND